MRKNIFEGEGIIEIGRVMSVEDAPSSYPPHTGVRITYDTTDGCNPIREELCSPTGAVETWDERFTAGDLQRGDVIRMHMQGPSVGGIIEVFRHDMLVFPQDPEKVVVVNEIAQQYRGLVVAERGKNQS